MVVRLLAEAPLPVFTTRGQPTARLGPNANSRRRVTSPVAHEAAHLPHSPRHNCRAALSANRGTPQRVNCSSSAGTVMAGFCVARACS